MASDERVEIAPGLTVPPGVVRFSYSRSSGPGGQSVNKLNTRATLEVQLDDLAGHLPPTVMRRLTRLAGPAALTADNRLLISSEAHRSQRANRAACLDRLRDLILRARVVPRRRKKTKPSRSAIEKRLERKKRRGEIKRQRRDFD